MSTPQIEANKDGAASRLALATGSEIARSPLCYMVEEHVMDLTRRAIEAGLENTQGALLEHDAALGRTTRKNRTTAEMLERDIENMQTALSLLPNGKTQP